MSENRRPKMIAQLPTLATREALMWQMHKAGLSNAKIAEEIGVKPNTVRCSLIRIRDEIQSNEDISEA